MLISPPNGANERPGPGAASVGVEAASAAEDPCDFERVWVARTRAGAPDAFAAIFRAYYARLCAFAEGYLRSSAEAEEVVEDVFVRIWERREQCTGCSSLKSYLFTAVRNRSLKRLRHERVVKRTVTDARAANRPLGVAGERASLDDEVYAGELAAAVQRAVATLPERGREAFLLHREHGLTYAQIATTMGISVKTVENHLIRATKALRAELSDWLT
jgi:RNA polymerase sigma-70 factor (family 1)